MCGDGSSKNTQWAASALLTGHTRRQPLVAVRSLGALQLAEETFHRNPLVAVSHRHPLVVVTSHRHPLVAVFTAIPWLW